MIPNLEIIMAVLVPAVQFSGGDSIPVGIDDASKQSWRIECQPAYNEQVVQFIPYMHIWKSLNRYIYIPIYIYVENIMIHKFIVQIESTEPLLSSN